MEPNLQSIIQVMKSCKEQRLVNAVIDAIKILAETQSRIIARDVTLSDSVKSELIAKIYIP